MIEEQDVLSRAHKDVAFPSRLPERGFDSSLCGIQLMKKPVPHSGRYRLVSYLIVANA